MPFKYISSAVCTISLLLTCHLAKAGCLTGSCHQQYATPKYLHGPVAAELAGGAGCSTCHIPAGKPCSPGKAGKFKPMASSTQMCQLCHTSGTGTQHSAKKIDCLKCHDPHGSETSAVLERKK